MMKRTIILSLLGLMALTTNAQQDNEKKITTIDDIVGEQQQVTTLNTNENHFKQVWGRNGFFNIAWVTGETMSPREELLTGVSNTQFVGNLEAKGLSIELGSNISLHKPIANVVRFNIDIQSDLTWTYYKKVNDGSYDTQFLNDKREFYMPWNLEDHKLQLGLAMGPSLTVAPFTMLDVENLHFMKFNIYYHFGYHGSVFLMKDSKNDLAPDATNYKKFDGASKCGIGHGITSSFGFGLSWKVIGLGYEYSSSRNDVKPFDSNFRDETSKFKVSTNRLFIQFRF